jgi:uncharacterized protein YbbC (DUF1343 family)
MTVQTGLDRFRESEWKRFKGLRLGLLANQASLDGCLRPASQVIAERLPGGLTALFGPQHGYTGADQDNMIETGHGVDPGSNRPVYSLYSDTREPSAEMFEPIDILLIDLQDVGTRVYTFASTMLNCLKAAARFHKKVVILDRPNPLGGQRMEGNPLKPDLYSFVGPYSLPMRHGLTMAEMARLFLRVYELAVDLEVIPLEGWRRSMSWGDTGLRWFMPSPNMPLPQTAEVYPGQVIWEGTNLSEGRGTCRPFELFGAPFIVPHELANTLGPEHTAGCHLQEITFRPTFHKWANELCRGFMIHILDPAVFCPYFTSLSLLREVIALYGDAFAWKSPPYEYEVHRLPIDLIIGNGDLRAALERGEAMENIRERYFSPADSYFEEIGACLLYG